MTPRQGWVWWTEADNDQSPRAKPVEEHSVYGGLGEAVGSVLLQNGCHNKFKIVGLPDEHTVSGSQGEIFEHYGISAKGLSQSALNILG